MNILNRKFSLRTKLSLSYVLVTLILVAVISVFTNVLLDSQFKDYIIREQGRKNTDIVSLIQQQYKGGGGWNRDIVENIGLGALEDGMIIKVKDASGNTIWDATVHNSGLCMQMLSHMSKNMFSRYPNWKGGYEENKYPVVSNSSTVGTVEIGYYGPFYYNDNDLAFINTLNRVLMGVGVFSLLFALLLGAYMAKRLSTPISKVINAAQMISKGCFSHRIEEKSDTKEISQLTTTINNLAGTLEKQETLRKRMTADVAHELRTPLATLQSHMEAMIDGIWAADTGRLKSCHEEIMRISRMVGDLDKLAKYESENLVLNKSEFDVSELIQHIIFNFETDYRNKGVEIKFNGPKTQINADRDKFSQVIINLLSNALKYSQQGRFVEVNLKDQKDHIEVSIKDTGTGIPPEDLPYIFERFYRADKSRNRLTGGSGIGLTITKTIVEAHKGIITVKSELNKGTVFTVVLPKDL